MDFRLTAEEAAFRDGLRSWLVANAPGDIAVLRQGFGVPPEYLEVLVDWQRRLHAAGYLGLHWPREYGGGGAGPVTQAIFYEEMARARAPEPPNAVGLDMTGPAIIRHGTAAQKARHLPRILSADHIFCQGFSEPNAGSDLAALATRAERRHGEWILTGQKVWTSFSRVANWCQVLARTNPEAPKHRGITCFLLDMRQPGVTVRPLRQISGDADFSEVFLDGARVPADQVLGAIDGGWQVALTTLAFERGPRTFARQLRLRQGVEGILALARRVPGGDRPLAADPCARQRLAQLYIDSEAVRCATLRALQPLLAGGSAPGPEGSVAKLHFAETWQRLTELALELQGAYAPLAAGSGRALDEGFWQAAYLRARGDTIAAGTSEIQRNIIAERLLALPHD
jgi:alkylation response protein AidB-like acyl-CoA dehydrogenase